MAEVMKLAYADRAEYGRSRLHQSTNQGLDLTRLRRRVGQRKSILIKPRLHQQLNRANRFLTRAIKPRTIQSRDEHGNVVATTYTLNLLFGSGIVATGTGITLNNEMDDFSIKPVYRMLLVCLVVMPMRSKPKSVH